MWSLWNETSLNFGCEVLGFLRKKFILRIHKNTSGSYPLGGFLPSATVSSLLNREDSWRKSAMTLTNSEDKRFGPKEFNIINPVTGKSSHWAGLSIADREVFTGRLSSAPGGLLEEDEYRGHVWPACWTWGSSHAAQWGHPFPLSAWEQLSSVVYKGCCCPLVKYYTLID